MKIIKPVILALTLMLSFLACACSDISPVSSSGVLPSSSPVASSTVQPSSARKYTKIGISMPKNSKNWSVSAEHMKNQLEETGLEVDLQYAEDSPPVQVAQVAQMIDNDCDILIITPVDGSAMTDTLKEAERRDIPVISFLRMIMNSLAVTYYVTSNPYDYGMLQGRYIEDALKLKTAFGSFNIELFTGSPDDGNIGFFWNGAMDVLEPYINSGKLVVKSGRIKRGMCATQGWDGEVARERMEEMISAYNYGPDGTRLDAVWAGNDSIALGITEALENAGYTKDNFPVITGMDCTPQNIRNIIAGKQSMLIVYNDFQVLAERTVEVINEIVNNRTVTVNDTTTYDYPTCLSMPTVVTKDNYKEVLIDSGYYTQEELMAD